MGRITVYTKDRCRFCDTVLGMLTEAMAAVAAETPSGGEGGELVFNVVNVTRHPERAAQCRLLSGGATTVPQVFFNGEHVGDSSTCATFHRSGDLVARLHKRACVGCGRRSSCAVQSPGGRACVGAFRTALRCPPLPPPPLQWRVRPRWTSRRRPLCRWSR